jgi:hypothetical protein
LTALNIARDKSIASLGDRLFKLKSRAEKPPRLRENHCGKGISFLRLNIH